MKQRINMQYNAKLGIYEYRREVQSPDGAVRPTTNWNKGKRTVDDTRCHVCRIEKITPYGETHIEWIHN